MENNASHRLVVILGILGLGIIVVFLSGLVILRNKTPSEEFLFGHIEDNKQVGNGRFKFVTQSDEVSLMNLRTRDSFLIPADLGLSASGTCENCVAFISVPQQDPFVTLEFATKKNWPCDECIFESDIEFVDYLITRKHNGGSGGYYKHNIFKVKDDEVMIEGTFLSCGKVYTQNHFLIFSYHDEDCPGFLENNWLKNNSSWQDDFFNLRDN